MFTTPDREGNQDASPKGARFVAMEDFRILLIPEPLGNNTTGLQEESLSWRAAKNSLPTDG